jgi:L-alanine-DL-glutamate epimerase-like enolase superfamily enzyme
MLDVIGMPLLNAPALAFDCGSRTIMQLTGASTGESAHNIALATLPNFVLPGDVSASKRYWKRDIIQPPVETTFYGTIRTSDEPGFGYALDHDFIRSVTVCEETIG